MLIARRVGIRCLSAAAGTASGSSGSTASSAAAGGTQSQKSGPRSTGTEAGAPASTVSHKSQRTQALLDRVLRVDHAGEFGAVRIYTGQIAVLGKSNVGPMLENFLAQEKVHLAAMDELIPTNRVRPSVLLPIWNIAGFVLGAGSALLGKEAAMACTVAVETVIFEHYDSQLRALMADGRDGLKKHEELIKIISRFRDEELEHKNSGLKHDAEKAPMYGALSEFIKAGCKGAIWLSERI